MRHDESLFDIDPARLDEQWAEQARLFYQEALKLADARADWERAKVERDLTMAEVDRAIRRDPEYYDVKKVTEPALEKAVLLDNRTIKAQEVVIEARHTMDVYQASVDAMEHRKKGLESCVHLLSMNFFSIPRAPKGVGREVAEDFEKKAARKRVKVKVR